MDIFAAQNHVFASPADKKKISWDLLIMSMDIFNISNSTF
jgi:hypothetical protein